MILVISIALITVVMGAISYGLGVVPLHLDVKNHIKPISLLSGGLLIGAALCLAIPESIENYNKNPGNDSKWIGISIMLGFLCMFLIDQSHREKSSTHEISVNEFELSYHVPERSLIKSVLNNPLTLALILHSFVDGISLGSSFHNEDITFILSLIIIIHKLPTVFSLSCLLIQQNLDAKVIKFHILLFSLATPVSSIITWIVLLIFNSSDTLIGILLLFSSGTFIYILTHVLSEFRELEFHELGLLVVGILISGFLSFMH